MNALFESIHTGTVTVTTYLIGIAAALLCGVIPRCVLPTVLT